MKIKFIVMNAVVASTMILTGCTTADMNAVIGRGDAVSTSKKYRKPTNPEHVTIYHSRASLPKHHTIIGRVAAPNFNPFGIPKSQAAIMEELKKQAASIGANGVTHISSDLAQTTAEAVAST